jgi:hypothetical protein
VASNIQLTIDVIVRITGWAAVMRERLLNGERSPENVWWRVSVSHLGELLDAMTTTLTSLGVTSPLADLAGIDQVAVPQPRVLHLRTSRPVHDVLDITGLKSIPDGGASYGGHVLADPALDLSDPSDRANQVQAWLVQLALDAGLIGMEQLLGQQVRSQSTS